MCTRIINYFIMMNVKNKREVILVTAIITWSAYFLTIYNHAIYPTRYGS